MYILRIYSRRVDLLEISFTHKVCCPGMNLSFQDSNMDHSDWTFVLALLDKADDRRRLKRSNPLVNRVEPFLIASGFDIDGNSLVLPLNANGCVETMRVIAQRKADESLLPESISFAQVADVLKRNGTLPGIRTDFNDSPLYESLPVCDSSPPPKPWELHLDRKI